MVQRSRKSAITDKSKLPKEVADRELTEELKQSFPASDPPTITRRQAVSAGRNEPKDTDKNTETKRSGS
ncbi:MAG: hypothetical protein JWO28_2750 [Hyphomicrobiales bacterium]|nr:hypothetical protein [Hyphomicrobiales bacterium]